MRVFKKVTFILRKGGDTLIGEYDAFLDRFNSMVKNNVNASTSNRELITGILNVLTYIQYVSKNIEDIILARGYITLYLKYIPDSNIGDKEFLSLALLFCDNLYEIRTRKYNRKG